MGRVIPSPMLRREEEAPFGPGLQAYSTDRADSLASAVPASAPDSASMDFISRSIVQRGIINQESLCYLKDLKVTIY